MHKPWIRVLHRLQNCVLHKLLAACPRLAQTTCVMHTQRYRILNKTFASCTKYKLVAWCANHELTFFHKPQNRILHKILASCTHLKLLSCTNLLSLALTTRHTNDSWISQTTRVMLNPLASCSNRKIASCINHKVASCTYHTPIVAEFLFVIFFLLAIMIHRSLEKWHYLKWAIWKMDVTFLMFLLLRSSH